MPSSVAMLAAVMRRGVRNNLKIGEFEDLKISILRSSSIFKFSNCFILKLIYL